RCARGCGRTISSVTATRRSRRRAALRRPGRRRGRCRCSASRMDASWDCIVIGGGPAGSSVATFLARAGRRVLLLERARFPREHIGESLLPGVLPYLDALGARELVEREGFERKDGQTFVWGRDREPWHIDFREL